MLLSKVNNRDSLYLAPQPLKLFSMIGRKSTLTFGEIYARACESAVKRSSLLTTTGHRLRTLALTLVTRTSTMATSTTTTRPTQIGFEQSGDLFFALLRR